MSEGTHKMDSQPSVQLPEIFNDSSDDESDDDDEVETFDFEGQTYFKDEKGYVFDFRAKCIDFGSPPIGELLDGKVYKYETYKRHVEVIERFFLNVRWNPDFKYCRRKQMEEFNKIMEEDN